MPEIRAVCVSCGAKYRGSADAIVKAVVCKKCGGLLVDVKPPENVQSEVAPPLESAWQRATAATVKQWKKEQRYRPRGTFAGAIASIVGTFILLGALAEMNRIDHTPNPSWWIIATSVFLVFGFWAVCSHLVRIEASLRRLSERPEED